MLNRLKEFQKQYQIISLLGKGSYGQVALVRSRVTKQQYAVKFYSLTQLNKINKLYSIKRSIKIVQSLKSPHIIRCYQFLYDSDKLLLQYQACPLGNLENYLKKSGTGRSKDVNKELICQLVQTLQYLSSMQVVHRDIKPSNVVFGSDGIVKLIDFDQAITFNKTLIDEEENMKIMKMKHKGVERKCSTDYKTLLQDNYLRNREQTFVGTPCYMPPEMKQNRNYDEKGDIWSLGCIIFEILTGATYFTEEDQQEDLPAEDRKSQRLTNYQHYIGQPLSSLLFKMLFKDPVSRPSISQIFAHPYLSTYRSDTSSRQLACSQLSKQLTSYYLQQKQDMSSSRQHQGSMKYDPFFIGFQILQQIRVCAIVLKKSWYFYSPVILKSTPKAFEFWNEFESQVLERVMFEEVERVEMEGEGRGSGVGIVKKDGKRVRIKVREGLFSILWRG